MLTLPPVMGEISLAGVLPFAGVGGSSRTRVIVVVVVVEYISILIIIIVVVIETRPAPFCQTVHLESSFFFKTSISHHKVMARQIDLFCCWLVFLWPAG